MNAAMTKEELRWARDEIANLGPQSRHLVVRLLGEIDRLRADLADKPGAGLVDVKRGAVVGQQEPRCMTERMNGRCAGCWHCGYADGLAKAIRFLRERASSHNHGHSGTVISEVIHDAADELAGTKTETIPQSAPADAQPTQMTEGLRAEIAAMIVAFVRAYDGSHRSFEESLQDARQAALGKADV
jgi:hypothetical protein